MFHSPRHLYFRHVQRALRRGVSTNAPLDEKLEPGEEHLQSYIIPGLQAGEHTINVSQTVDLVTLPPTLQNFNVLAPQYVLPEDAIQTFYPPQGFTTTAETLPHVIFNDPTLPWERVGSWDAMKDRPDDYLRNRTPWMAVIGFTDNELKLGDTDLNGPDSLFKYVQGLETGAKQDSNFAVKLAVGQMSKVKNTTNPYKAPVTDATPVNTIFVKRELFNGLFSKYDKSGKAESRKKAYVYHHRFLAHKRNIDSQGTAVTGAKAAMTGDDTGSNRSGPLSITSPTPVYVHVVSIEGIEQMGALTKVDSPPYVALVSLASWSYVCLPPDAPNVRDQLVNLGNCLAPLCPTLPQETQDDLERKGQTGLQVLERLRQGYSLSRYRTQTGEVSSCFTRGPFVPVGRYEVPEYFTKTSMTGLDLSILDGHLGIMDISYSAAWQLGRTMAIADQAFTTCLYRLRTVIIERATDLSRQQYIIEYTDYKDKERLLRDLKSSVDTLSSMIKSNRLNYTGSIRARWARETTESLDLSYHGLVVDSGIDTYLDKAARDLASTPNPTDASKPSDKPYDEFNAPFSADWVVVLRWVLDALLFTNIPVHYLLTDSSHLPHESLRFFMIDDNWMNAFLDGAISLGNHVDRTNDKVRNAIKGAINWFLSSPSSVHSYSSPVPKYGCFIRSAIISQFPDLIVEASSGIKKASEKDQPPILLRHEIVDKGTMLCLFSEPPSSSTFASLTFTQPPHQQTFAVGKKVTATELEVAERRAYTVKNPQDPNQSNPLNEFTWKREVVPEQRRNVVYKWDTTDTVTNVSVDLRMLLVDNFADDYMDQLKVMPVELFSDDTATSALMAWQLNQPAYMLPIQTLPDMLSSDTYTHRNLPVYRRVPPKKPDPPTSSQRIGPQYEDEFVTYEERKRLAREGSDPRASPAMFDPMARTTMVTPAPEYLLKPLEGVKDVANNLFPVFRFFFWSLENPGTPDVPGKIEMLKDVQGNPLPQSLIFSIRIIDNAIEDFKIKYIEITIPQGKVLTTTLSEVGSLTTLYDGPGATMLSNLRFNPLTSFSTAYDELIIRLIPRSLNNYVTADMCKDLSFLLSGVKVNISNKDIKVMPTITIHYYNYSTQKPTQSPPPSMVLTPVSQP